MRSQGALYLEQVTNSVGADAVARAMHVLPRVIARWIEGVATPDADQLQGLAICYNVPPSSWYATAPVGAIEEPPAAPEEAAQFTRATDSLDLLNAQLERIWRDIKDVRSNTLGGVNYSELVKLESQFTKVVEKRAIVAGQLKAIEENRLARTETFKAFVRKVVTSLRNYPEARAAVVRDLGGELPE